MSDPTDSTNATHSKEDALERLLKDGLAVPQASKAHVLDSLSAALRREQPAAPQKNTLWSAPAAAAVLLVVALGTFALVAPGRKKAPSAVPTPATQGRKLDAAIHEDESPRPAPLRGNVDEKTIEAIETALKELGSDSFELRDQSQKKLIALGTDALPFLREKLKSFSSHKTDPELLSGLQTVINRLVRDDRERKIREMLAGLELAVNEAPKHYLAPDPAVSAAMQKRISFEFVDMPMDDALAWIAEQADVRIVTDPVVKNLPRVNLRVNNMNADLALDWICKLAEMSYVFRGPCGVVTTEARASKLRLRERTLRLDGAPWTLEETESLAAILQRWPDVYVQDAAGIERMYAKTEYAKATAAGEIVTHSISSHTVADYFNQTFNSAPRAPQLPELELSSAEMNEKLAKKVVFPRRALNLEDAIALIREAAGLKIMIHPQLAAEGNLDVGELSTEPAETVKNALLRLARNAKVAVVYKDQCFLLLKWLDTPKRLLMHMDLRPALRKGITQQQLDAFIARPTPVNPPVAVDKKAVLLRGIWFGELDADTADRVRRAIHEAGQTGKLPELPPAPWYNETFENIEK